MLEKKKRKAYSNQM